MCGYYLIHANLCKEHYFGFITCYPIENSTLPIILYFHCSVYFQHCSGYIKIALLKQKQKMTHPHGSQTHPFTALFC
jgi:hypothetical protein